ncbi:MAG: deoxyguanosinetriphosphate triphosphohydrolase [Clostridia bacterium]|nr:deoxyguanosinetriphosphate triphosphohydrolase [Clostridia bacterium]
MESIRDAICQREEYTLSPHAFFSADTAGREQYLAPDPMRTEFQRDRDRIIHSKAFRRLMHKTQVFLCPEDDHYRTRLTHTLEVCQIARTISRSLFLNEDLTEAIALGHDLGHTPFGHAGERVLRKLLPEGFEHYEQSLRVVDKIEHLNLTFEVRDGIVNHAGDNMASTLEGQVVKYADRIAYLNHDIDDAVRARIISPDDIPLMLQNVLGYDHSERIATMVGAIVRMGVGEGRILMEKEIAEATDELRTLLFGMVYTNPIAKGEEKKADGMLSQIFEYYLEDPSRLPPVYAANLEEDGEKRCVADYVAGMTDRYAINLYKQLFIPKVWQGPVDWTE